MAESKARLQWSQTSLIACILWNTHCKPAKKPQDFDPFHAKPKGIDWELLKSIGKKNKGKNARPKGKTKLPRPQSDNGQS